MLSRTKTTAEDTAAPGGKAPRRVAKPRVEGRPYKKLDDKIMLTRIGDIENKLLVHNAKSVLLRDRLAVYKREQTLREEAPLAAGLGAD